MSTPYFRKPKNAASMNYNDHLVDGCRRGQHDAEVARKYRNSTKTSSASFAGVLRGRVAMARRRQYLSD